MFHADPLPVDRLTNHGAFLLVLAVSYDAKTKANRYADTL